jgi:hypothetical protein
MSDDFLPPMPGEEEEYIDYSELPIMVNVKGDNVSFTFGEAMELMARLTTTIEAWWKINGRA